MIMMMTHSLLLHITHYIQYINIITQSWILSGMWDRKGSQKSVDDIKCIMYYYCINNHE